MLAIFSLPNSTVLKCLDLMLPASGSNHVGRVTLLKCDHLFFLSLDGRATTSPSFPTRLFTFPKHFFCTHAFLISKFPALALLPLLSSFGLFRSNLLDLHIPPANILSSPRFSHYYCINLFSFRFLFYSPSAGFPYLIYMLDKHIGTIQLY